jgi:XrtN system VIT domain protein
METLTDSLHQRKVEVKEPIKSKLPDSTEVLGLILLVVSASLYALEEYIGVDRGNENFTIFFIHYFLSIAYVVILIITRSYGIVRSWRSIHFSKTIILLNLFLVSAYALNRELPVFEDSVTWLCVLLVVTSTILLSYRYFDVLPKAINYVQHIFLGCALVLYLYMTIYVANFYMFGTIGILLLGIGAHIFVPLLLFFSAIRLVVITQQKKRVGIGWMVAGIFITVGIIANFIAEWNVRVKAIDRLANQSVIHADTDLPVWVKVAQSLRTNWITERILKSRLVYTVANDRFHFDLLPTDNNWDEVRKHDPLVFLASGNSNSSLSADDRKNILLALTDSRHKAQERLWSGDNLSTSYIVTDVDLYPEFRFAYAEHFLNIRNNAASKNQWSGNTEEAIYTFQLPEGSVVTSLSLWINGEEKKAVLTSKQKATEAYTTIVGKEARDPSVVHWQEGNTISVRVFPCTSKEERKFKIGITSPLSVVGNQLIYRNVTFRGPDATDATQTSRVRFIGKAENIKLPDHFEKNTQGEFTNEDAYDPDLQITMDITPISANSFSFDGMEYSLVNANPSITKVEFTDIYLDMNNSWTSDEISSIHPLLKNYQVYVYLENQFVLITSENWEDVTNDLRQANFSLFPFHHIKNTEASLVITKGKELSPHLRDFKTSAFAEGVSKYFASGKKVFVFNLDGGTSTYIKSLKELRAFNFAHGSAAQVLGLLQNKTYPIEKESDERIMLHESHMAIEKKVSTGIKKGAIAPDHLARLFAYNDIMRQVGVKFFNDDFIHKRLVDEAAMAYVVSPVSSLIVLESRDDYARFGINDIDNTLGNASKNSSGAVPEPHEWALIILFLALIAFYFIRHSKFKLLFAKQ